MAGTQVPKGFGFLFVLVGVPLILWSAWGTNDEIKALSSPDSRQKRCVEIAASQAISSTAAEAMCRCVVSEAEKRGLNRRYGGYDAEGLKPVFDLCYAAEVAQ